MSAQGALLQPRVNTRGSSSDFVRATVVAPNHHSPITNPCTDHNSQIAIALLVVSVAERQAAGR